MSGSIRDILQRNGVGSSDDVVEQLIHVSGWLCWKSRVNNNALLVSVNGKIKRSRGTLEQDSPTKSHLAPY